MRRGRKNKRQREPKQRRLLWHYTVGIYLDKILRDGMLLTEAKTTAEELFRGQVGALWFSSNELWERTAGKGESRTMQENHELYGGLVRFGVEPADDLLPWAKFRRVNGMSGKMAKGLARTGRAAGACPGEWYVSLKPVPKERWVAIEIWDGGQWITVVR